MFENILSESQRILAAKLFPEIPDDYYLTGGTAVALQLGHRKSIDFDLATHEEVKSLDLDRILSKVNIQVQSVLTSTSDEYTIIVDGVKFTFYNFPFNVPAAKIWNSADLKIPDILSLAAMKAYALGRRSKWKDYVDLYFILQSGIKIEEIIELAKSVFTKNFNQKLFREQLCYFEDIDFSEGIDYIISPVKDSRIKNFLEKEAVQGI